MTFTVSFDQLRAEGEAASEVEVVRVCIAHFKGDKSAIMSDEVYMMRTNNVINTDTERGVKATQVIVSQYRLTN